MKKIFDFSTHSEFDQSFEQLQNNVEFQRLNDKFKVKPFYLKYKGLKTLLLLQCTGIQSSSEFGRL